MPQTVWPTQNLDAPAAPLGGIMMLFGISRAYQSNIRFVKSSWTLGIYSKLSAGVALLCNP
jgi:hypothetical protein